MKAILLSFFLALIALNVNAQMILDEDFESYEIGTDLSTKGYTVTNGTALVARETGSSAYSGEKYALLTPNAVELYFSKTFTLEVGKTYTYEVSVVNADVVNNVKPINSFVKLGEREIWAGASSFTSWGLKTVTFTVGEGETEVQVGVYRYANFPIWIDKFMLYEGIPTSVTDLETGFLEFYPNPTTGKFKLKSNYFLSSISIYNMNGKMVNYILPKGEKETIVDISKSLKGLYLVQIKTENGKEYSRKILHK